MNNNLIKISCIVLTFVMFSISELPTARAGLLDNWSTTSAGGNLAPTQFSTGSWSSDVHFAVYYNGDPIAGESGYQNFGPPYDITTCGVAFPPASCYSTNSTSSITVNGGEYLYVYQIDHDPSAGSTMSALSVGIDENATDTITSIGFTNDINVDIFGLGSGDADDGPVKAVYSDISRSAWFSFSPLGVIEAGNESHTLFFTSTAAPTYHASTLTGGTGDTQLLPSPMVPEPISSILFISGAATLGFRRFRQNRAA